MKKLNNAAAAFLMMAILVFGTTAANAGILVSDATGTETKTSQTCTVDEKPDWGIIIQNIVGIIIQNLTGSEVKTSAPTNCGIIIQN